MKCCYWSELIDTCVNMYKVYQNSQELISVLHYWDGPLLSVRSTPKKKPVVVNPTTIRSRQMLNSMCIAVLYMIGGAMMNERLYDKTPKRLLIDE
jgi:hypothetical protein